MPELAVSPATIVRASEYIRIAHQQGWGGIPLSPQIAGRIARTIRHGETFDDDGLVECWKMVHWAMSHPTVDASHRVEFEDAEQVLADVLWPTGTRDPGAGSGD